MTGTSYARYINKNIFDQSKTDPAKSEKKKKIGMALHDPFSSSDYSMIIYTHPVTNNN